MVLFDKMRAPKRSIEFCFVLILTESEVTLNGVVLGELKVATPSVPSITVAVNC